MLLCLKSAYKTLPYIVKILVLEEESGIYVNQAFYSKKAQGGVDNWVSGQKATADKRPQRTSRNGGHMGTTYKKPVFPYIYNFKLRDIFNLPRMHVC